MSRQPTFRRTPANLSRGGAHSSRGGAARPSNPRPKPSLNLSFSDSSSSESSDLPTITTATTNTGTLDLISDSDSEESSSKSPVEDEIRETDWSSKQLKSVQRPSPPVQPHHPGHGSSPGGAPNRMRRPIRKTPRQQEQTQPPQKQALRRPPDSVAEEQNNEEEEYVPPPPKPKPKPKISSQQPQPPPPQQPQDPEEPNQQTPIIRPPQQPQQQQPPPPPQQQQQQQQQIQPQPQPQKQQPQPQQQQQQSTPAPSPSITQPPPPLADEQTFQIVYEQRNFMALWKRYVQMTQRDVLIYRCESIKTKQFGKSHIICTKAPCEFTSPNYVGMLVRHQLGTRFTLYGRAEKSSAAQPQIMGLSFIDMDDEDSNIRTFRVAIPDKPFTPSNKKEDLSRIAMSGQEIPGVKIWGSVIPTKHEDGSLTLDLGPYSILRSTKNFVVRDSNGCAVFTIFKTFDGICTVKVRPPFTPILGFAVAAAISTSSK